MTRSKYIPIFFILFCSHIPLWSETENTISNLDYFSVALSKNTQNIKVEVQSSNLIIGSEINYNQFSPSGFYWTPKTDELNLSLYGFHEKEFNGFDLLSSFRIGNLSIKPAHNGINFSNLDNEEVENKFFHYFSTSMGLRKIINKFCRYIN